MKKILPLLLATCLLAVPLIESYSQDQDPVAPAPKKYGALDLWGVGVKATTDGIGFELVKGFGERLNIRLGYSFLDIPVSYALPAMIEGFSGTAEANLKFGGVNLYLDFYPVKNVIHLTAGVMLNSMRHTVQVIPTSEFPFGDIIVPPSEIGIVEAEITPETKYSPYAALGFGNTLSRKHRVSFNFELGALYHGSPQFNLTGTNMLSPLASENNIKLIEDAIAQYKWYPMVSLQLTFRII